jgi:hypothetical protein
MPGTTSSGFPYAVPADPLVQWPATSQSLAEKVQAELQDVYDVVLGAVPADKKVRGTVATLTFDATYVASLVNALGSVGISGGVVGLALMPVGGPPLAFSIVDTSPTNFSVKAVDPVTDAGVVGAVDVMIFAIGS